MGIEVMLSPYMHSLSNKSLNYAAAAGGGHLAVTPAGVPSCVGWQGACVYDLFQARRGALWTRVQRSHRCHSSTADGRDWAGRAGKDPPVHVRPRAPRARRALWPLALVARLRRAVTQPACVHRSARATAHALSRAKALFRAIRCADGDQQEAIEQLVYNGGQWPAGGSFSGVRQASAIAHITDGLATVELPGLP